MPFFLLRTRPLSTGAVLLIASGVVLAYLAMLSVEGAQLATSKHRWWSDDYDRNVYHRIAQFYPTGQTPYRDVFSEYPTLATLAFATPYLTGAGPSLPRDAYHFRWSVLMAIALVATIAVVALTRVRLGLSAAPALLLLGPSTLYFSLMRFDILCALVLCLSLAAFARGRYLLAHVLLGVATLVKWYPAVVFPVYLAFHLSQEPALARHALHLLRTQAARYAAAYALTVAAIVALTIAAVTWDGFMMPYRFHAERGGQYFNPYWLVEQMRPALGLDQSGWNWVNRVFLALQVSILPMLLFTRVRSLTQVVQYSVLAIYLFVTFGRVDSPQWILWTVPPVLMFAREARTLIAVAVLTVCNYLVFPVAYDALDPNTTGVAFSAIVLVKDLILLALIVLAFRDRGPEVSPADDCVRVPVTSASEVEPSR